MKKIFFAAGALLLIAVSEMRAQSPVTPPADSAVVPGTAPARMGNSAPGTLRKQEAGTPEAKRVDHSTATLPAGTPEAKRRSPASRPR